MDSRQLQCFIAAAKEKSIIKAADYLPLTPSAIAKKIIALEGELGVALFERLARGVRLTPAGEVWFQHAQQLLDEMAQASHDVHRASQSVLLQRLDIAAPNQAWTSHPGFKWILADFSRNNPNMDIVIHYIPFRQQQLEALRKGIILAAFNNEFQQAPDLVIDTFTQRDIFLVTSIEHALANHAAVPLEKLRECPIISYQEKPFSDSIEDAFIIHNISPKIVQSSSDTFAHLGMCACNMGVTLLGLGVQRTGFPGIKLIPLLSETPLATHDDCAYLKGQSSPLLKELIRSIQSYRNEKS